MNHPPVDFQLYGLVGSVRCERWLEFVEGEPGRPVWSVWLGHRCPSGTVVVTTHPAERFVEVERVSGDVLPALARVAATTLLSLTMPPPDDPRRTAALTANVWAVADDAAAAYGSWPRETWTLGTVEMSVPVWAFAGGWAGIVTRVPAAYLIVFGQHCSASRVALAMVDDVKAYGLRPGAPLTADLLRGPADPPPFRSAWHVDHRKLL